MGRSSTVLSALFFAASTALASHDVKMTEIQFPIDTTRGRWPAGPAVMITNVGTYIEDSVPVRCWIDSEGVRVYDTVKYTWARLYPGHDMMLNSFPAWAFAPANFLYHITLFTDLANDSNRANDTMKSTTYVKLADVCDELIWQEWNSVNVNGYIDQYEWDYWQSADISDTAGRGGKRSPLGSCILYCDNTTETAYFAFDVIPVHDHVWCDSIVIKTDEDHDGQWAPDSSEGVHTGYVNGFDDSIAYNWLPGQRCPGTQLAASFEAGNLQIEGAVPIGPRRSDLTVAGITGMAVSYWHGDTCIGWWPQTLEMADWKDPSKFGTAYWWHTGVQDSHRDSKTRPGLCASLCRGVLFLPDEANRQQQTTSLLDVTGRRVMDLNVGENDVSLVPPGVYVIDTGRGLRAKVVKLK